MSRNYLDGSTLDECIEAIRQGRTLDDLAGRLHVDTEYLGRLLQLPTVNMVVQPADYLWHMNDLEAQL